MFYQRIDHIALRVSNLDASLAFYVGILGMRKGACERNAMGEIWIQYVEIAEDAYLELFPSQTVSRECAGHLHHICIGTENLQTLMQQLQSRQILCYGSPWDLWDKQHAVLEPSVTSSGSLCAWVEDPDQNAIELVQMNDTCRRFRSKVEA